MELGENKDTIIRLAGCVVLAVVVYYGADQLADTLHIDILEQYKPWLAENRIQAIAVLSAVFFGLSLAVYPPERAQPEPAEETPER